MRHVGHIMLFSFSFRRSPRCRQHACRPHRVGHLSPKSVKVSRLIHVNIGPIRGVSNGPDSMRASRAPSVCGLPGSLFLTRFVFSPACENSSESTTVRRTNCWSSQAACLHSCIGSSASPISSRQLPEISGLRTSATSQVVFTLLPALVLTRKRRCPQCLMCDPFPP